MHYLTLQESLASIRTETIDRIHAFIKDTTDEIYFKDPLFLVEDSDHNSVFIEGVKKDHALVHYEAGEDTVSENFEEFETSQLVWILEQLETGKITDPPYDEE